MRAEELQIGDLVWWQDKPYDPYIYGIFQVSEIGRHTIKFEGIGDEFEPEQIEPIKLTTKILDRNFHGYKSSQCTTQPVFYYDIDGKDSLYTIVVTAWSIDFCMRYDDPEHDSRSEIFLVELPNVHTLQHTLRLFGIEKELDIRQED